MSRILAPLLATCLLLGAHSGVSVRANDGTEAVSHCQITSSGSESNTVGFPIERRFKGLQEIAPLKAQGTIRALLIPIDFPNYPGITAPSELLKHFGEPMDRFFDAMSYGRIRFHFNTLPSYVRMSKRAEDYGLGTWGQGDYRDYYVEALKRASATFDIRGFDVVFVAASPETSLSAITPGPAFLLPEEAGGVVVPMGAATGGMTLGEAPMRWIAHEAGHLFGWADLYDVRGFDDPNGNRHSRFGWWDIMSMNWETFALDVNAWFRFLVGWLEPRDVVCLPDQPEFSAIESIAPLSASQGKRAVVIRVGPEQVIVAEYRTRTPFSPMQERADLEGLLVYRVDGAKSAASAPMTILRKAGLTADRALSGAALRPGEVVESDGLLIENLRQDGTAVTVQITRGALTERRKQEREQEMRAHEQGFLGVSGVSSFRLKNEDFAGVRVSLQARRRAIASIEAAQVVARIACVAHVGAGPSAALTRERARTVCAAIRREFPAVAVMTKVVRAARGSHVEVRLN